MTLGEILQILLNRIKFIIIITLLGLLIGFGVVKFLMDVEYTSSVSIYVKNTDTEQAGQVNTADISASKSLVETYMVILQNEVVLEEVGHNLVDELGEDFLSDYVAILENDDGKYVSAASLSGLITMSAESQTEVMLISSTTENAKLSAAICNTIKDLAPEILQRVTKAGSVEAIGDAKVPTSPSGPDTKKITAIGGLLGLMLSCGIAMLLAMLDTTVKNGDDVIKHFDYPILAEIPDVESESSKKGANGSYV